MRKVLLGFAALALSGTVATAADVFVDVPVDVPVVAPAGHDWSGWYLGGYAGHLWGEFTHDWPEPGLSGLDAGVQVHYNAVMSGGWVLSPYLAATLPVQKAEIQNLVPVQVKWAAQAGLRLGYAHGRWLPYVYAGGVVGAAHGGGFVNETHTHFGYQLGAGFEYAVDDHWTVGARYAYYHLGPQDYASNYVGWRGHSVLGTISFKIH